MADNKIVSSSQRNLNDVAFELTENYINVYQGGHLTKEEFADLYKFFYQSAFDAVKSR